MKVTICDKCKEPAGYNADVVTSEWVFLSPQQVKDWLQAERYFDICKTCFTPILTAFNNAMERFKCEAKGKVWLSEKEKSDLCTLAIKKAESENFHFEEFSGKNCDDCTGWTVGSHRCDCGNRRMTWGSSFNDNGTVEVWPEAY